MCAFHINRRINMSMRYFTMALPVIVFLSTSFTSIAANPVETNKGVLKSSIRINPSQVKKLAVRQYEPGIVGKARQFDDMWRSMWSPTGACGIWAKKSVDCMNHAFSIQEQRSAGCTAADSQGSCNEKLLRSCMGPSTANCDAAGRALERQADVVRRALHNPN